MPEDEKDAQHLNDKKSARVRSAGYEAPLEENAPGGGVFEQDIAYHNRYGTEDEQFEATSLNGPLDEDGHRRVDMGYHNQFFHD
jgi:hypothetical protein